ncbi:bifunctional diaminohydroxyphosphoribosylaminopyrimidine deaminase/5-amino-6-(5-phosphoribosylamino)uracil reductase RibD [Dyella sp. A6]|uniref:bifunctional diaminohydroxyphosphoribosylaminopyrimidine deaminase/5-amino-6-(5-phosphoribosylamino)uracil reductase RibD n=1 Tax=Dyella aluminiiresistens TaxID=3069105 RepID=UPI002E76D25E|nr:bifunctional diaminohydroxyphosphoribosylaminopyrimidine deaminase/5-amino-6-(5-phosphoribosylamino)uracil reductase RibD [Dyella sp. A6]
MARALALAERGLYTTQPNPRVGCVIAHGDRVVGEGWHQRAGGPHAEVFALRDAGEQARGATAYVTLEPCGLHGRTPPCADALIAAGIARVVIAAEDTSQAEGAGLARLRGAGITVETGLLREPARALNPGFFSRIERGRPFVRLKLAMSLDGRTALANGASKWITGEPARADVQRWRARASAILSGSGTVLADDPRLTVRLPEGEAFTPPCRVVLDRDLRVPAHFHVMDDTAPTLRIHAVGRSAPADAPAGVRHAGVALDGQGRMDLAAVLGLLAGYAVNELHVEAGARLGGALLDGGWVDELLLYVAPVLLGDRARPLLELPPLESMAGRWRMGVIEQRQVGTDWRLRLHPLPPAEG